MNDYVFGTLIGRRHRIRIETDIHNVQSRKQRQPLRVPRAGPQKRRQVNNKLLSHTQYQTEAPSARAAVGHSALN